MGNIYDDRRPFHSFRKVLSQMGSNYSDVELCSYHSTSKGIFGECGIRGGYMDLMNIHPEGKEQLYKMVSISLCPNTAGQVTASVMCDLPRFGEASYENHKRESDAQYQSLLRRSRVVSEKLDAIDGYSCQAVSGAMY